jgi:hypothetical protein
MKNISTGFGLCVAAAAALAHPFVSSLAPNANASAVTAAAAVSTAATGQAAPTIVWYDTQVNTYGTVWIFRAWSDGRVEGRIGDVQCQNGPRWSNVCSTQNPNGHLEWFVISDPAQGLTYRSDINFDEKVDGADLATLLNDWGNAPRQDIPLSDCPLALINP